MFSQNGLNRFVRFSRIAELNPPEPGIITVVVVVVADFLRILRRLRVSRRSLRGFPGVLARHEASRFNFHAAERGSRSAPKAHSGLCKQGGGAEMKLPTGQEGDVPGRKLLRSRQEVARQEAGRK